jgi:hypothetical protein
MSFRTKPVRNFGQKMSRNTKSQNRNVKSEVQSQTTPVAISNAMHRGNNLIFVSIIFPQGNRMMMIFSDLPRVIASVSTYTHHTGESLADWDDGAKGFIGIDANKWWTWMFPCDVNLSNRMDDVLAKFSGQNHINFCTMVSDMQRGKCTMIEMEKM